MPRRPLTLALLLVLALGACGGESETPAAPDAGTEPALSAEAAMLDALAGRVRDGTGISDASWTRDVQEVGMALWPDDASPEDLGARRDHTNLTHIAGDMAGHLAGGEEAERADWTARDPLSVRIYDAFVRASGAGMAAYRTWVVEGGRALLRERIEALQSERPPR